MIERIDSIDAVEIEPYEAQKVQLDYNEQQNVHVFNDDFFGRVERVLLIS